MRSYLLIGHYTDRTESRGALTAPMSAHLVARAGYGTQNRRPDLLVVDELEENGGVAGR